MKQLRSSSLLTVNAGSSSIKFGLFAADSLQPVSTATIANIGQLSATLTVHRTGQAAHSRLVSAANHAEAATAALDCLHAELADRPLAAIGHRVVHGGPYYTEAVRLTDAVVAQLEDMIAFDPEHLPVTLKLIKRLMRHFSKVPHVACFDTTFYRDLPAVARLLPLPRRYQALGLRRYGFHGLSYTSLLDNFRAVAGEPAANGRIILAHLGSGASLTALRGGRVLDTTMSFTPASGIPMSSRSGDLDPGIADFLRRQANVSGKDFNHMVHFEAGLLGVSELSSDMYELLQHAGSNPFAAEAVELFCYQVRKTIGGLTAVLGGLDSLIFAGGIGENAPAIRAGICDGLDYLGIAVDAERNAAQAFLISGDGSQVGIHVLQADEATVMARQTSQLLTKGAESA